jgi:hypothetical protein
LPGFAPGPPTVSRLKDPVCEATHIVEISDITVERNDLSYDTTNTQHRNNPDTRYHTPLPQTINLNLKWFIVVEAEHDSRVRDVRNQPRITLVPLQWGRQTREYAESRCSEGR